MNNIDNLIQAFVDRGDPQLVMLASLVEELLEFKREAVLQDEIDYERRLTHGD